MTELERQIDQLLPEVIGSFTELCDSCEKRLDDDPTSRPFVAWLVRVLEEEHRDAPTAALLQRPEFTRLKEKAEQVD
jgi:hypothetical protein